MGIPRNRKKHARKFYIRKHAGDWDLVRRQFTGKYASTHRDWSSISAGTPIIRVHGTKSDNSYVGVIGVKNGPEEAYMTKILHFGRQEGTIPLTYETPHNVFDGDIYQGWAKLNDITWPNLS